MNFKKNLCFLLTGAAFLFSFLFLVACGQNEFAKQEPLQCHKKYVLLSWPDSAYVASLDSILQAEPLKASADSEKTQLTIYSGAIPTIRLPGQKAAQADSKEKRSGGISSATPRSSAKSAESFADNFTNALNAMLSDPTNVANSKIVHAKQGEDLFTLLSRAYGKNANKLPRFYTLSALQSVNPGIRLEHLNEGDPVRIPKI
ncbi:hypothetical protein [uncultured Fibrobacter sp.]|uniref:hypothetical protein n=1 Tax=uncultured Fibrobacter sp. TaxID=261512 RepID=UPI00259A3B2F|nr:hypothetical protein [uncultured Fibrobacter sp.]